MAMMMPPIKFAMKSLAAKPKAKPPRPPKENKSEVGKPKVTKVAAHVANNVSTEANRTKINFLPSSVCAELSGKIFFNIWLPYFDIHIDTTSPAVKIYVPRSNPSATFSGTAKLTYIASTNSHVTSKMYPVIHKNIKALSGFPTQCAKVSRYGESGTSSLSNCLINSSLFGSYPPPNTFIFCFSNHKKISRLRLIINRSANIAQISSTFHGSLIFWSTTAIVDFVTAKESFTADLDALRNSRMAVLDASFRSPLLLMLVLLEEKEEEEAANADGGFCIACTPTTPATNAGTTNCACCESDDDWCFFPPFFAVSVLSLSSEEEEEEAFTTTIRALTRRPVL
mmetsp:Transcript_2134/g.6503  ORF Transcript_2134/g.6503 Transcript_2134/m.6503 type:complete len:340 (+) Transcript_2134:1859-2878(+)